jgi:hypothetical protein
LFISQGQAILSTFACSLVIHFILKTIGAFVFEQ